MPKKIFIVDDDVLTGSLLQDYLTQGTPHQTSLFGTGEECLSHLNEKPDVIILDYNLNSKSKNAANGMEILQAIKKHYPHVHIIMLSSQEHYGLAMQTIQKGAEQYVIKDNDAFKQIADLVSQMQ